MRLFRGILYKKPKGKGKAHPPQRNLGEPEEELRGGSGCSHAKRVISRSLNIDIVFSSFFQGYNFIFKQCTIIVSVHISERGCPFEMINTVAMGCESRPRTVK